MCLLYKKGGTFLLPFFVVKNIFLDLFFFFGTFFLCRAQEN